VRTVPSFVRCSAALLVAIAACREPQPAETARTAATTDSSTAFGRFANAYFDSLYAFAPSAGVAAGFHQYDARLEDLSSATIARRMATLSAQLARLDSIRSGPLVHDDSIDAAMMDGAIRTELLDKQVIGNWHKNPILYASLPGTAIDVLMKRNFAPAHTRLQAVIARLRAAPALLGAMRANVDNPPAEFTDIAIRVAGGSIGFFRGSVAAWAKEAAGADTASLRAFTTANDSMVRAMRLATDWLTRDLKPRSHGSFAIGAKNFADKLRYDEMIDIPLDRLLAIGESNLAKDHADFLAIARLVAPGTSAHDAMLVVEADHPTAATLIPSARATVAGTRQFLIDHAIVDIPSAVLPTVTETPPYARVGSFASMDSPGAFDSAATEAFYYVTPPETSWDARHVEEHLRSYNRALMDNITVHEVFPGHFLQFLYAKQFPTKTRKLLGAASNIEGWAHYGEQMMIEQGFGNGDPKAKLAQLGDALLRDCRFVAGIKEHTQGLSVQRAATDYFVDQCFQEPANGYEEARRGTYDPTYLYYTFGKLEIYKLRDDYRRAKGTAYSLRDFHDQFVRQGGVPIKLLRRILLPGDTAAVY
jgi:uncharacterized protein (DUF885 family)